MMIVGRRLVIPLLLVMVCGWTIIRADNGTTSSATDSEDGEQSFEQLEKKLKVAVQSVVKRLLPELLRGSSDANISGPCTASIMKIIGGIRQLKEWAMRFVDAAGKIPPGVMEGTSLAIGDYEECLDIEVGKRDDKPRTPDEVVFRGQYCLMEIQRPDSINRAIKDFESGNVDAPIAKTKTFLNMFVRYKHLTNSTMKVGVCVPSKCTKEDVENIMNTESIREYVGAVGIPSCKQKGDEKTLLSEIILLSIFCIIFLCILLGTCGDIFFRIKGEEEGSKPSAPGILRRVAKKTSLYSNALDVLDTSNRSEPLECLCGLRTIIVILVIYAHSYAHLHLNHFQKFSNAANFLKFFDSFTFAGVGNASMTFDSIIFVSAITITYSIWRNASDKRKVDLHICRLLLQRYVRWTAAQLLVICFFLLTPLFGSGPIWPIYMDPILRKCRQNWWVHIIYLTNFWESTDVCLYHTWVLAVLMQLTLLGVIIILILKRSFLFGVLFMVLLILMGIIGVAAMTIIHELPGTLAFFMLDIRTFPITWRDIYILPYDHIGAFCIGLLAGYLLAVKKDRLEISKLTSVMIWCGTIGCNIAIMFGLYKYRHGDKMDLSLSAFYAAMHRNVWCFGIGWIVIACTTHHGGPVSRVLKSKVFVPLDRLCYMAFLLHMPLQFYHSGILRERWYMGHVEILFLAISYMVLSFVGSFLMHITFVAPYFALEEHVCSYFKCKDKVTFDSKTAMKEISLPESIATESVTSDHSSGCVNLAYSKKLDGL